jgi:hypothetical protein
MHAYYLSLKHKWLNSQSNSFSQTSRYPSKMNFANIKTVNQYTNNENCICKLKHLGFRC